MSKEGACRLEDGSWRLMIEAPEAREISIRLDEKEYPFTRDGEGKWTLEFRPEPGFWFFFLKIDGANVVHPAFPIGFGYSRPMNFLNVPGDDDFWLCRDVPHGFVVQVTNVEPPEDSFMKEQLALFQSYGLPAMIH